MKSKNFEIPPRKEGTRSKKYKDIESFDLDQILEHFTEEIREIKGLFGIADELVAADKKEHVEYIWRAQIVFLVSALDYYMHGLTRYGLGEMYEKTWKRSNDFRKLKVNINFVEEALSQKDDEDGIEWFFKNIIENYKRKTMGSYDSIKRQLDLLGIDLGKIASNVFDKGPGEKETEEALKALEYLLDKLYERRNIIAHQSNRSHETAEPEEIRKCDVDNYITRVESIVEAIDAEARTKEALNWLEK